MKIIKRTSFRNQKIKKNLQVYIYLGFCLCVFEDHILRESYLKYLYSEFSIKKQGQELLLLNLPFIQDILSSHNS